MYIYIYTAPVEDIFLDSAMYKCYKTQMSGLLTNLKVGPEPVVDDLSGPHCCTVVPLRYPKPVESTVHILWIDCLNLCWKRQKVFSN